MLEAMLSLRALLLVAGGGAVGCVLRYVATALLGRGELPWGTLAVNVVGSFLIALLLFGAPGAALGTEARLLLVTGLLGGFTTMSAFAFDTVALVDAGRAGRALAYVLLTTLGSLGAAAAGRWVALHVA